MDEWEAAMRELLANAEEVYGIDDGSELEEGKAYVDLQHDRLLFRPNGEQKARYWEISHLMDGPDGTGIVDE